MDQGFTILCDNCEEKTHTVYEKAKGSNIHNEVYERYLSSGDYEITFECKCGNISVLGE